jgi:hypothetical protein
MQVFYKKIQVKFEFSRSSMIFDWVMPLELRKNILYNKYGIWNIECFSK